MLLPQNARFFSNLLDYIADGRCQNPDYKVQIVDAVLFARNAEMSTTVQMAHIKALEKGQPGIR